MIYEHYINMIIPNSYSYTPNFRSRKKEIRDADKIMRNATNNYPMVSTSKVPYYSIYDSNPYIIDRKRRKTENKIDHIRTINWATSRKNCLDSVMKTVKDYKVGNCGEMAVIMYTTFLANGYDDVKMVSLHKVSDNIDEKNIDHEFLLINAKNNANSMDLKTIDKHAFIVDPWLGFVDYVPAAISKYKNFFPECNDKTVNGKIIKNKFYIEENPYFKIKENNCEKLSEKYPELVINNDNKCNE